MANGNFSVKQSEVSSVISQLEEIIGQMKSYQETICSLEEELINSWQGEASEKFDKLFRGKDLERMKKSANYFIKFVKLVKDVLVIYKNVDGIVAALFV